MPDARRPSLAPVRAWAIAVDDRLPTDLGWVDLPRGAPDAAPFSQRVDAREQRVFRASRRAARQVPVTATALHAPGGATLHDALDLLLASSEWRVESRALLFTPWSPHPALLARLVESVGIEPIVHHGHPAVLRALMLALPQWVPVRGGAEAATGLLREVARLLRGELRALEEAVPGRVPVRYHLTEAEAGHAQLLESRRRLPADPANPRRGAAQARIDDLVAAGRVEEIAALTAAVGELDAAVRTLGGLRTSTSAVPAVSSPVAELRHEVLACWPTRWWRARWQADRQLEPPRIEGRAVKFQGTGIRNKLPLRRTDVLLDWHPDKRIPLATVRLLPPWTVLRLALAPPTELAAMERTVTTNGAGRPRVFRPDEGAILDLESLQSIDSPVMAAWTVLGALHLGHDPHARHGTVIRGLRLQGMLAQKGPPGSVILDDAGVDAAVARKDPARTGAAGRAEPERRLTFEKGEAVLEFHGAPVHVIVPHSVEVTVGPTDGAVVMQLTEHKPSPGGPRAHGGALYAWRDLDVSFVSVPVGDDPLPPGLLLARRIRRQHWETDLSALWQPEDKANQALVTDLLRVDDLVWQAVPQGLVWDDGTLGTDWIRYQAAASAALQTAVLTLQTRATSTAERVRLLLALGKRLDTTVPDAAKEVQDLLGPSAAMGPYKDARQQLTANKRR
ncbi:MAG: hypothetical protein Q8P41_09970 [Pseudomonadota bacterium]|nr:hypothetical protein [Pseudomonadota bacterium]